MGEYFQNEFFVVKLQDHFADLPRTIIIKSRNELSRLILKLSEKRFQSYIEILDILVFKDIETLSDILDENKNDDINFGINKEEEQDD